MTKTAFLISLHFFFTFSMELSAQNNGELIFSQKCTACHTIGEGKRVGPDLADILKRRDEDWLIKFIRSSQELIKSGDPVAKTVFEENNKVVMPDHSFSTNEIKDIIKYISTNSPDPNNPNKKTPAQIFNALSITQSDINHGKNLFEGTTRFANGGAACISCHNVEIPGVFSGGTLSKDLTTAFTRVSPAGIDGILRSLPFPAMTKNFEDHPLTDKEVKDLLAFLYYTDNRTLYEIYSGKGDVTFLVLSVLGINIALLLLLINWKRVKKYSVNSYN